MRRSSSAPSGADGFFSDSPRWLKRRYNPSRSCVSDIVCSVTCKCLKCRKLAREPPSIGPQFEHTCEIAKIINASEPRDFAWLLSKVAEPTQRMPETLRINIPETVFLEKGKPRKLYYLDSKGELKMSVLTTGAELLRVLKNYIKLSIKREMISRRGTATAVGHIGYIGHPSDFLAENKLQVMSEVDFLQTRGTSAPLNIAHLHFTDGAVREMTFTEAEIQVRGRNKLDKDFWLEIGMVQCAVQSSKAGVPLKYITYRYDARFDNAVSALESWQKTYGGKPQESDSEKRDLENVAKLISAYLREKLRIVLVSGQFEFMRDQHDGTLWLLNASRLYCASVPGKKRAPPERTEPDVKCFSEEEFAKEMAEHMQYVEQLEDSLRRERRATSKTKPSESPQPEIGAPADDVTTAYGLWMFHRARQAMAEDYDQNIRSKVFGVQSSAIENFKAETDAVHNIPVLCETSISDIKRTFARHSTELGSGTMSDGLATNTLRISRVPAVKGQLGVALPRVSRPQSGSSQVRSQGDTTPTNASTPQNSRPPSRGASSRPAAKGASLPPSRSGTSS